MKEQFITKRFNGKSKGLLDKIHSILAEYAAMGMDITVRQLYYRLVTINAFANSQKEYKKLVSLVSDARLAGILDWSAIVDLSRSATRDASWKSPADILRVAADSFTLDKWVNQPNYVEVMVEKQALQSVLQPVCSELDITFTANKGYSSQSAMYRAGKRFLKRAGEGKGLHILYLGDHDPSGIDMTNDIEQRVPQLGGTTVDSEMGAEPLDITVTRVALNIGQVKKFKLIENPCKMTDARAAAYVAQFGRSSWELDAVEPRTLADMVRKAVLKLRDEKLWKAALKKEAEQKAELEKVVKKFEKADKKKGNK